VIYKGYKITIAGSVTVQSASGETKLLFRIKGEINRNVVRSQPRQVTPDGPSRVWQEKIAEEVEPGTMTLPPQSTIARLGVS
jgi:hypothetical protein